MKKYLLTFCIDVESFDLPNEFGRGVSMEEGDRISLKGLESFEAISREFGFRATFFVTKDIAAKETRAVRSLAEKGNEIALHSVFERKETESALLEGLKEQKGAVEEAAGRRIYGHRSHKFLPLPLGLLEKAGFFYDNSLHPTCVPGRYCNIFKTRRFFRKGDMVEVPVSVAPFLRAPFSSFWFRILGAPYAKACSNLVYLSNEYLNIYFHSWEFADIASAVLDAPYKLLLRHSGERMVSEFRDYLRWATGKGASIVTMLGYVHSRIKGHVAAV